MNILEQIKDEFDIKDIKELETLTQTKWCEIKRKINSEDFDGFIYYYFRPYAGCPWIDPETFHEGYIWNTGGDVKQKLISGFKNRCHYQKIPKMKTYVHEYKDSIILIPAYRSISKYQAWEVIRIMMKNR